MVPVYIGNYFMQKIKILHVLEAVGGGTKKALLLQLNNLNEAEFDITVCLPPASIVEKTRVNELNDPGFGDRLVEAGYRVEYIPMYGGAKLEFFRNLLGLWKLWVLCRREQFDIVHGHSSIGGFLARIAGRLAGGCATVYSPEGFAFSEHTPKFRKAIVIALERLAGAFTDMIVACSATEKNQALSAQIVDSHRIIVIENPVALDDYSIAEHEMAATKATLLNGRNVRIVGTVARLAPQKNPLDFIRVASVICRSKNDVEFFIVGDGRMRGEAQALIEYLGLENKVHLLGNRSDYLRLMSCFDVFILTSLWEGLPYAPVEALLLGIPIVINDVTGAVDIVGENGIDLLIPPLNPEAMAIKIIDLLDHPAQAKELVKKISADMRYRFDGRTTSAKMTAMYRQLISYKVGQK